MLLQLPNRELNWIRRKAKDLPVPAIVLCHVTDDYPGAAACCWAAENDEYCIGGEWIDFRKGAILIDPRHLTNRFTFEATLAHEWRHHWQNYNIAGRYIFPVQTPGLSHKASMVEYFTTSPHEFDALTFESKYAPDEVNLERLEWALQKRECEQSSLR